MKTVRFHPEAEAEMIEAAVWYESQQATLGKRFVTTVQDALNRMEAKPAIKRKRGWILIRAIWDLPTTDRIIRDGSRVGPRQLTNNIENRLILPP